MTRPGPSSGTRPATGPGPGGEPDGPAPARIRLDLAYDGTGFAGFAAQPGRRTVAGVLADAVARVTGERPPLTCAGRTDAGVHARGQVVHLDLAAPVDPGELGRALTRLLGPAVVVTAARAVGADFDARRSATVRRYRYLVHEADRPDPLLAHLAWYVPGPLDLRAMQSGADVLVGEHDFRAFCRQPQGAPPGGQALPRAVADARWRDVTDAGADVPAGRLLRFDIAANAFCHQMVRALVAVLVAVGRGRLTVADVHARLATGARTGDPPVAPAHGLSLEAVDYGDDGGGAGPAGPGRLPPGAAGT